jgi:hypothetical protein
MAPGCGWDEHGVNLWKLTIRSVEVPGRRVIVDRE